jgi:hypothetical protein
MDEIEELAIILTLIINRIFNNQQLVLAVNRKNEANMIHHQKSQFIYEESNESIDFVKLFLINLYEIIKQNENSLFTATTTTHQQSSMPNNNNNTDLINQNNNNKCSTCLPCLKDALFAMCFNLIQIRLSIKRDGDLSLLNGLSEFLIDNLGKMNQINTVNIFEAIFSFPAIFE